MIYCINKGCTVNDFCNIENSRLHGHTVTKNKHKFSQIMTTWLNQKIDFFNVKMIKLLFELQIC